MKFIMFSFSLKIMTIIIVIVNMDKILRVTTKTLRDILILYSLVMEYDDQWLHALEKTKLL